MVSDTQSHNYDTLHPDLKARAAFIVWKLETLPDRVKPTKVLYSPATHTKAKTSDALTWGTFVQAVAAYEAGGFDGVGYVLSSGDPYTFIDLDCAIDPVARDRLRENPDHVPHPLDGLKPWAQFLIKTAIDKLTYCALSQSGTGLHLIGRGKLPGQGRRVPVTTGGGGGIEMYDTRRFVALTGNTVWSGDLQLDAQVVIDGVFAKFFRERKRSGGSRKRTTDTPISDTYDGPVWNRGLSPEEVVAQASKGVGEKFTDLHAGNVSAYSGDASRADMAYVRFIYPYTGPDPEHIEVVLNLSDLPVPHDCRGPEYQRHSSCRDNGYGKCEHHSG
jgi:primase-polymerase (primpol)-like protein